jgi:hypothetical protein
MAMEALRCIDIIDTLLLVQYTALESLRIRTVLVPPTVLVVVRYFTTTVVPWYDWHSNDRNLVFVFHEFL